MIRDMQESDKSLIYATWLRSQYYGNTWFKSINKDIYYDNYKRVVEARLASCKVLVLCLTSDPETVIAYSVVSQDEETLHWIYTKKAWRKKGYARELVPSTITTVSSMTKIGKALNKSKYVFNPFK
jgi:GNAT superfamily N-acetyltransferase